MARLNDMVLRIVRPMFRVGLFEHPAAAEPRPPAPTCAAQDVALARTISENGTVLLKNAGGVAAAQRAGTEDRRDRPGRRSAGRATVLQRPGQRPHPRGRRQVRRGQPAAGHHPARRVSGRHGALRRRLLAGRRDRRRSAADVAVVFAGAEDSEGTDRQTMTLGSGNCTLAGCTSQPVDQDALISAVAAANPHTIVVLNTGGPVQMPWLEPDPGAVRGLVSGPAGRQRDRGAPVR